MSKIDTLLSLLNKVKSTGPGKWIALCPAHEDKRPSLGIKLKDDDKILLKCWCGCAVSEIVSAVGLTLADLMPESPQGYDRTRAKTPGFNKAELFDLMLHASTILSLAIRQLANGIPLTHDDMISVTRAEALINELDKESRYGK